MFKKSLIAVAVLGATAFSVQAADVTMYGKVDLGLQYKTSEVTVGDKTMVDEDTFSMENGRNSASRFGIKGSEDLGNGYKAGFVLESSIKTDDGSLGQGGRLWGREARVYLSGDFGEVSFGRVGPIVGGNGPYARFGHVMNAFSCGWGDVGGSLQVVSLGYEFVDNAVTYLTPKFGGLDAVFQYSFGADTQSDAYKDGTEGKSSVERMYAGAVRYQNSTVLVSAGVEGINQDQPSADRNGLDDALSFNLGGSYDAGFAKFYVYSQVFQNYAKAAKVTMFSIPSGVDGYGVNLGFETKALGGTVKASFGWGDFEGSHADNLTMKTYQTALGYNYPLSRRRDPQRLLRRLCGRQAHRRRKRLRMDLRHHAQVLMKNNRF